MKIEIGEHLADSAAEIPAAAVAPLRIAFLSYRSDPKVGGQGAFLSAAAAALADRGHKVDVISGPPYPELRGDIRLVRLPSLDLYAQPHHGHYALRWRHFRSLTDLGEYFGHLSGKFMEPWSFGRRAARYLAQHRDEYDVVFDNQTLASGLLDIRETGLPVVGVIHHPIRRDRDLALTAEPKWKRRWLIRRWYSFLRMHERVAPRLDRLAVISEASRRDAIPCLHLSEDAMTVVPIGIDIDTFKPSPHITRLPNRLLAVISADVPLKGLRFLVEAYGQLLSSHPDLELHVIGRLRDGPTTDAIHEFGLEEKIVFRSDVPMKDLVDEYARATILVSPSLYEGYGLPAAEAICCGAPVVATDGGALPEVVGDAGIIVPKGDAAALAAAIDALLRDPERRARMSAHALAVRHRYSWAKSAAAYEAILRSAMLKSC